ANRSFIQAEVAIRARNVTGVQKCALPITDPDGNALTFTKAAGPTFMTVTTTNATTGNIHLAPGFSDSGTYGATVTATDNGSPPLSDSKTLTIGRTNVRTPVTITARRTTNARKRTSISLITTTTTEA